jgi:hypothetical protein
MTQDILVNTGEEYYTKTDLDGVTVELGLYNDATDGITDTDNLSAFTSEPENGNYARQSSSVSVTDISGDWGIETDTSVTFDFTDVQPGDPEEQDVDTGFFVVNFQSVEAGDGSASDNLFGTFALTQSRNIADIDELDISAGNATATIN